MNNPQNQDDDIVILGAYDPEEKKKLAETARPMFEEIERERQKEKKRKRRANYKPRGSRQKQIDPVYYVSECIALADLPVTSTTVRLATCLYDICDEKEFVVGTLRCTWNSDLQTNLLEYLKSHDNPSTQDIALHIYSAMAKKDDQGV